MKKIGVGLLAIISLLCISSMTQGAENVIVQPGEVRRLPGRLNTVPMFNSNSPEVIQEPGILLSTFDFDYALKGDFDVFFHHIAKAKGPEDNRTLSLHLV